jgi:hypothetical protein
MYCVIILYRITLTDSSRFCVCTNTDNRSCDDISDPSEFYNKIRIECKNNCYYIIKIGEKFFNFIKVRKIRVKNRKINLEMEFTGSKLNLYNSEMMIHSTFFLSMPWLKGNSEY